jgi:hypothetical protein
MAKIPRITGLNGLSCWSTGVGGVILMRPALHSIPVILLLDTSNGG